MVQESVLNPEDEYCVHNFVKKDFFMNAGEGVVKIVCKASPIKNNSNKVKKVFERIDILDDYESLLFDEKSSDFTVVSADGKNIYVHKAILSCRSPVFKAMFERDMLEKNQSVVNIVDIEYEVLVELYLGISQHIMIIFYSYSINFIPII